MTSPSRPAPARTELRTEIVDTADDLRALVPAWRDLVDRGAGGSPFLDPDWVTTWWDVFGASRRLLGMAVRSGEGTLVGLAPFMVGRGDGRLLRHLRQLMFLGQQGDTHAEHLDLVVEPGREPEVVPAIAREVLALEGAAWDRIHLERVRGDSPCLSRLEGALADAGLEPRRTNDEPSPYVSMPSTFDAFLSGRSANFRRQLRNAENRLAREGKVHVRVVGEDLDLDEGFDVLVRLHRARWGPDDGSFRTEAYLRFHRTLSRRLHARNRLLLAVLEVAGEPVAARYDFLYRDALWCFQGGWRPDWDRMRPGTVLTARVLRRVVERGEASRYELLSGEDAYKRRWADGERRLVHLEVLARTLRARGYRWARALAGRREEG